MAAYPYFKPLPLVVLSTSLPRFQPEKPTDLTNVLITSCMSTNLRASMLSRMSLLQLTSVQCWGVGVGGELYASWLCLCLWVGVGCVIVSYGVPRQQESRPVSLWRSVKESSSRSSQLLTSTHVHFTCTLMFTILYQKKLGKNGKC